MLTKLRNLTSAPIILVVLVGFIINGCSDSSINSTTKPLPGPIDLKDLTFESPYYSLTFSPDGKKIAVIDQVKNILQIFETNSGKKILEFNTKSYFSEARFSIDGNRLLTGAFGKENDTMKVFDISNNTAMLLSTFTSMRNGYLSDDGKKVIARFNDDSVTTCMLSADDGKLIKKLSLTPNLLLGTIWYLPKENAVFLYGAEIWGVDADRKLRSLTLPSSNQTELSEDGERISSTNDWITYTIFSMLTGTKLIDIKIDSISSSIPMYHRVTNNYLYVIKNDANNNVCFLKRYNTLSGNEDLKITVDSVYKKHIIAVSRNEEYLAVSVNKGVRIWKIK